MADNGVQALEGTEAKIEDAAPMTEEKKAEAAPQAAQTGETPAAEAAVSDGRQDAIRSVFVARTAAWSVAPMGGFAQMETADDGFAVRGAYVAHLSVSEAEAVAGESAAEGELLRKAYLARAVADAAVQPSPKRPAARPARRSASSPGRKAATRTVKKRARRAPATKAKKRATAGARAKPRATRAARPARRGKRRGR